MIIDLQQFLPFILNNTVQITTTIAQGFLLWFSGVSSSTILKIAHTLESKGYDINLSPKITGILVGTRAAQADSIAFYAYFVDAIFVILLIVSYPFILKNLLESLEPAYKALYFQGYSNKQIKYALLLTLTVFTLATIIYSFCIGYGFAKALYFMFTFVAQTSTLNIVVFSFSFVSINSILIICFLTLILLLIGYYIVHRIAFNFSESFDEGGL